MKVVVAGTRNYTPDWMVRLYLKNLPFYPHSWEVVTGMCPNSPDMYAYDWAVETNRVVHQFPADWEKLGKKAGMVRNRLMAVAGDRLIAFWDGKSKGTANMIRLMHDLEKPYIVVTGER